MMESVRRMQRGAFLPLLLLLAASSGTIAQSDSTAVPRAMRPLPEIDPVFEFIPLYYYHPEHFHPLENYRAGEDDRGILADSLFPGLIPRPESDAHPKRLTRKDSVNAQDGPGRRPMQFPRKKLRR